MTSPADPPSPPRHPKRLTVAQLEARGAATAAAGPALRPALLALALGRADRTRALAQRPDALRVLGLVLDRIEAALRPQDRYAVVATDEIWILVAHAPADAVLRLAANAILEALRGGFPGRLDDGTEVTVLLDTAIGGAWLDVDGPVDPERMAAVAGHALLEARAAEDRITIAGASTDRERLETARLESRVRRALESNELEVWFQPQVRLDTRRCVSFEALIRWPRPQGMPPVSPALIVAVCERSGMVGELTRFVLNTTLRTLMAWRARGTDTRIAINLSATTLADPTFPEQVSQACDTWGVPASRLVFELTEGSIARHERTTIEFMERLHALGCGLSIDDFGTGYSSFAYLRHFPADELKIDRAFVRELVGNEADRRIVRVLVEVAHALGMQALAEGVEDAETTRVLHELGCDLVQGWHFAKAMPAPEAIAWLDAFSRPARVAPGTLQTA
jgi:EAL domain-containing protein (putative c-di-GMP-specific phosphodiesterase class I)/GGDEF domain-containing protein